LGRSVPFLSVSCTGWSYKGCELPMCGQKP
jgi:hypothetical protein